MTVTGPEINALVDVDVAGWASVRHSRVDDVDDEIVVVAPLIDGGDREPPVGSPVTVTWTGPSGAMELRTSLVGTDERAIRLWRLLPQGPVMINQRRDHVRVATLLSLVLHNDGSRIDGHLVDLSEGGLRGTCRAPAPLGLGDHVDAVFDFDQQLIEVAAEVVRVERHGEHVSAGCRFIDVPLGQGDLIRRFVFARQRRERAQR